MATGIKKTKPMPKSKTGISFTRYTQYETHKAQIKAWQHGVLWAVAEVVWNHFSDEEFDHNDSAHWQGAGYKLASEFAKLIQEGLKILPALVVKTINSGIIPSVECGSE